MSPRGHSMGLAQTDFPIEEVPAKILEVPREGRPETRDDALALWLATLEGNGVRASTRGNYEEVIHYLPDVWPLDQFTILRWWKDLGSDKRKRKVKPVTRHLRATIVKNFCAWAAKTGVLDEDPFLRTGIVPPKPPKGEPRKKIFTRDELNKLFGACNRRSWWDHRMYVMMRLLLRLGLRVGEICLLIWDDVDWDRPRPDEITIRLRVTKGSGIHEKPEEVVLTGTEAVNALRSWYHRQGSLGQSGPMKFVFPTATWQQKYDKRIPHFTGKPFTPHTFYKTLARHAERAEITRRIHPHMFRHSFGTAHYDQFGDLEATKISMRHKNSNTTRLYMDTDKMREHVLELQRKFALGE